MTFLPVVERELRVASRRPGTYWGRFAALLIALGVAVVTWMEMGSYSSASIRGQSLFYVMSGIVMLFSFLSGVLNTADAVSEEKRDGTLGLLFLTDLKGYDVTFGKLAATSLNAFYRLVVTLPVLAVPLMLGGVALEEFARMALVLCNTMFLSLAVGIAVSTFCVNDRKAMGATFLILLILAGGSPLLGAMIALRKNLPDFPMNFLLPSPVYAFGLVSDAMYRGFPERFWTCIGISHAIGWAALAVSSAALPKIWQDRPAGTQWQRWSELWRRWKFGDAATRLTRRALLLDANPTLWLALRSRRKTAAVFTFLFAAAGIWMWAYYKEPMGMLEPGVHLFVAFALHTVLKFWVTNEAVQTFWEARQGGALELILTTPHSVSEIVRGQLLALARQFGPPVIVVLAVEAVMWAGVIIGGGIAADDEWSFIFVSYAVVFVADLIALACLGMWLALRARKANRATVGALWRILALPWIIGFVSAIFMELLDFNVSDEMGMTLALALALGVDAFYILLAWTNLHGKFRDMAAQRYAPALGFLSRWRGKA